MTAQSEDLAIQQIGIQMLLVAHESAAGAHWQKIADFCIDEYRKNARSDDLNKRKLAHSFLESAKSIWSLTTNAEKDFHAYYELPDDLGPLQQSIVLALAFLFPIPPIPIDKKSGTVESKIEIDSSKITSAKNLLDFVSTCQVKDGVVLVGKGHPLYPYACLHDEPVRVNLTYDLADPKCPISRLECFHPAQPIQTIQQKNLEKPARNSEYPRIPRVGPGSDQSFSTSFNLGRQ